MPPRPLPSLHLRERAADYAYAVAVQTRRLLGGPDPGSLASGSEAPVLLLPGVYETWHFLLPVARRLHDAGHPVHTVPGLGINRAPVLDAARTALATLEDLDLHDVVLVAHSKGGLIGKRMMLTDTVEDRVDARPTERIAALVAVNTPFAGSRYASYAVGRTLRAFAPGNANLLELATHADVNSRITSVYAEFDPHIPETSRLEGATNVELPVAGHFRPLSDPLVLDAVLEAVARS
ncbi:esterase/lipase family protein [Sanguibacter suaedae]|uniref:Alpha/beta hydrolase n=1 Tax=Sanguibacter suaedae TaxID=2795737 RepID=A0A934I7P6_9MICO|nr:alpha/beta hydrolase [Sanguibacter suaedae]MBI9113512.1 alpha/beta hydrolase [Sanguibacter suaedae]